MNLAELEEQEDDVLSPIYDEYVEENEEVDIYPTNESLEIQKVITTDHEEEEDWRRSTILEPIYDVSSDDKQEDENNEHNDDDANKNLKVEYKENIIVIDPQKRFIGLTYNDSFYFLNDTISRIGYYKDSKLGRHVDDANPCHTVYCFEDEWTRGEITSKSSYC